MNRQDILPRSDNHGGNKQHFTSLKERKSEEEGDINNQKKIIHHSAVHDTKIRNVTASSSVLGHNNNQ
jgi:hypothetical protein